MCYDVCVLGVGLRLLGLHDKQLLPGISIVWGPQTLSLFLLTKKKGPSLMQLGCRATRTASSQVETVELWSSWFRSSHPLACPSLFARERIKGCLTNRL